MANENSIYQSINQVTSLNQQVNILGSSAASIKISQSFVNTIQASYKNVEKLKEETQKVKINSSIVNTMEKMKTKSDEMKSSFKQIGKGNDIKASIEDQNKNILKFIEDIRQKKVSIKAIIDISKESIDKVLNSFNFSANMQMSSSIEINFPNDSIEKNQKDIKQSLLDSIKKVISALKGLKVNPSLTEGIKQIKNWLEEIKTLIKNMYKSDEGIEAVQTQAKHFVKFREEVKKAKEEIIDLYSSRKQIIKIGFELPIENLKDKIKSIKKIKSSPIGIRIKTMKEDIKKKINGSENIKLSPIVIGIKMITKDIDDKIKSVRTKIKELVKVPKTIIIKAFAYTSLAIQGIKKLKEKCKEKFSVVLNVVDKTKEVFKAIKGKFKMLSIPVNFINKSFISPALKEQKKQNEENAKKGIKPNDDDISNAAHQMERVKKSIDGMKVSIGKVFLPIIGGVLKPLADWLQTYQPKIEKFLVDVSKKVSVVMQNLQPTFKKFFENLSKTVTTLTPTFNKVFENIPIIVKAMQPVLEKVFDGIALVVGKLPPVFDVVIKTVSFLGKVWKGIWPTISSILETAWAIIDPIFSILVSVASIIVDIFTLAWPRISGAIEGLWKYIEPILDLIAGGLRKIAEIASSVAEFFGLKVSKSKGGAQGSSNKNSDGIPHAIGLSRVPYDNYPALLHEGERVLTKQEVNSSRGFGSVNIGKLAETVVVREEADIDKIAAAMVNRLQSVSLNMA